MKKGVKILEFLIRYYMLPPEGRAWIHGYFTPAQVQKARNRAAFLTIALQITLSTGIAIILLPADHPMTLPTAIGLGSGIPLIAHVGRIQLKH